MNVFNIDPRLHFSNVINHIKENKHEFDFLLYTGDIADDGEEESYQFILDCITYQMTDKPVLYINGNHDNIENLSKIFSKNSVFKLLNVECIRNWIFVGVNSCVSGAPYGHLAESEMKKIEPILKRAENENRYVCVVVHHHPVLVGTPLIDECPLTNRLELSELVHKYKNFRLILSGHVHNNYKLLFCSGTLETGIATSVQFNKNGTTECDIDIGAYGYKIYTLFENGEYISNAVYL